MKKQKSYRITVATEDETILLILNSCPNCNREIEIVLPKNQAVNLANGLLIASKESVQVEIGG